MSKCEPKKTQYEMILAHLKRGFSINPIEALNRFGCFRLAAVIFDMKSDGIKIKTELVYKNNKHYAKYRLVK